MNDAKRRSLDTIFTLMGLVLARLVSPLLSFLILVLVARIWGQAVLGKYNTVWVWLILFRSLTAFGVGELITKSVGADRSTVFDYLTHGLIFGLVSSLVGALVMVGGAFAFGYSEDIRQGILIVSLILPFHACTAICQAVLVAFQKTRAISLTWIFENVLFVATGAIVIVGGYGFLHLFWCLVLARASAALANLLIVQYYVAPLRLRFDWGFFRKFLPPLAIFGVSSLAYQMFMRIDVVMLSKMTDMDTVGLYSSAANVMEVCTLVLIIFYIFNLPAAASGYRSIGTRVYDLIETNASQLFILVFPMFGFGFCFAHFFMPLVYGSSFAQADWILRILMGAFLIQAAESILAMTCLAADRHREVMYVVVARAVVNIAFNLVLIPTLGALGAALATVLSILFSLVAFQIFMKRSLGSLRWTRMLGKPALACLLAAALVLPLAAHVDAFLLGGIFLIGYGLLVFALGGFRTAAS